MATEVLTNAAVVVGGTDLSDHVQQVDLTYESETQDDTAMGMAARSNKGGLKNWNATVTFFADEAASEPNAVVFPLVGSTTTLSVRAVNAATSATNPAYNGTALVSQIGLFGQSVGNLRMTPVTFVPAEGSDLTRSAS